MADVKSCDKCGGLFSPRGPWQTLHCTTFGALGPEGQPRTDISMEVCAGCMFDPTQVVVPQLTAAPVEAEDRPPDRGGS